MILIFNQVTDEHFIRLFRSFWPVFHCALAMPGMFIRFCIPELNRLRLSDHRHIYDDDDDGGDDDDEKNFIVSFINKAIIST